MTTPPKAGSDPRIGRTPEEALALDELEPIVGQSVRKGNAALIIGGFALAAIGLFFLLNSHRSHTVQPDSLVTPAGEVAGVARQSQAPPPPLKLAPPPAANIAVLTPAPAPAPIPSPNFASVPPPPPLAGAPAGGVLPAGLARERAPTMVVDLGASGGDPVRLQTPAGPAAAAGTGGATSAALGAPGNPSGAAGGSLPAGAATLASVAGALGGGGLGGAQLGGDDQFAQRVGEERPARSRAVTMHNLESLVPQGTIIPAALETAIDFDLPGYTRAVVSRDVRSFDGKSVLIPRGSRIIGQYKSAVSLGASRAFVIWTRIIRSDGVSIQIGSPGTDPLGRGGLSGEVNHHFFTRFGGSILLSVLNAGVAAVSRTPSTNITIGSPGAAMGAANSVQGQDVAPTIKVAQGSAVSIFVARDLDFSDVAAVK